jgi:hypothetical protein
MVTDLFVAIMTTSSRALVVGDQVLFTIPAVWNDTFLFAFISIVCLFGDITWRLLLNIVTWLPRVGTLRQPGPEHSRRCLKSHNDEICKIDRSEVGFVGNTRKT